MQLMRIMDGVHLSHSLSLQPMHLMQESADEAADPTVRDERLELSKRERMLLLNSQADAWLQSEGIYPGIGGFHYPLVK